MKLAFVVAAAAAATATATRGSLDPSRPNILYIMSDDHTMAAISAYDGTPNAAPAGEGYINTPNIDRIANEGIRFDRAYVTNSICGPSRAAGMTGKFSHKNGFYSNEYDSSIDESQWTFPKEMQDAGYYTAIVGKYHLGRNPESFDYWNILVGQGQYYTPVLIEMGEQKEYPGIHATDLTTNITIETLDTRVPEDTPFMLMMHQKAPHRCAYIYTTYIDRKTHTHTHAHIHTYTHIHRYIHTYINAYIRGIHVFTHTHIHVCMHIYINVDIYKVIIYREKKWKASSQPSSQCIITAHHHHHIIRNWMAPTRHLGYFGDKEWPIPDTFFDKYEGRLAAKAQDMRIDGMFWSNDQKLFLPEDMDDPGTGGAQGINSPADHKVNSKNQINGRMNEEERAAWLAYYEPLSEKFFDRETLPTGDDLALEFYQIYMREYMQTVVGVDESVGTVLDYLEDKGLLDNTLVVYTGDQGFYLGEHGWFDKRYMYEISYRTPLLMRLPGTIEAGRTNEQMVMNLDFASTFLDLAGLGDKIPDDVQGESFLPILKGDDAEFTRDAIYYHFYENPGWHEVPRHYGVKTLQYKLMHFYAPELNEWQMFDLYADPNEMNNIYSDAAFSSVREGMEAQLDALRIKYDDSCPPLCSDVSGPIQCPGGDVETCTSWCTGSISDTEACEEECAGLCTSSTPTPPVEDPVEGEDQSDGGLTVAGIVGVAAGSVVGVVVVAGAFMSRRQAGLQQNAKEEPLLSGNGV
jgi:arylsulfatase A-like enzyme